MAFILPTTVQHSPRAIKNNEDTIFCLKKCGEHKLQFNATTNATAQETLLLEEDNRQFYTTAIFLYRFFQRKAIVFMMYKPLLGNEQCVVYEHRCDLRDADYVGYMCRHLFQRINEHKYSVIGKHLREVHNLRNKDLRDQFTILKKCRRKLDCLIYEMLFIKDRKPSLNTQSDSIKAKLFIWHFKRATLVFFIFYSSFFIFLSFIS